MATQSTTQKTQAEQAQQRIATYANLVSPDVGAATNGLKNQLEEGAKKRLLTAR